MSAHTAVRLVSRATRRHRGLESQIHRCRDRKVDARIGVARERASSDQTTVLAVRRSSAATPDTVSSPLCPAATLPGALCSARRKASWARFDLKAVDRKAGTSSSRTAFHLLMQLSRAGLLLGPCSRALLRQQLVRVDARHPHEPSSQGSLSTDARAALTKVSKFARSLEEKAHPRWAALPVALPRGVERDEARSHVRQPETLRTSLQLPREFHADRNPNGRLIEVKAQTIRWQLPQSRISGIHPRPAEKTQASTWAETRTEKP